MIPFVSTLASTYLCAISALLLGTTRRRKVVVTAVLLCYTCGTMKWLRQSGIPVFDRFFLAYQGLGLLLLVNHILNISDDSHTRIDDGSFASRMCNVRVALGVV